METTHFLLYKAHCFHGVSATFNFGHYGKCTDSIATNDLTFLSCWDYIGYLPKRYIRCTSCYGNQFIL